MGALQNQLDPNYSVLDKKPEPEQSPERKALYKWRAKNREHYNAKQREYQAAYRTRKRAEKHE